MKKIKSIFIIICLSILLVGCTSSNTNFFEVGNDNCEYISSEASAYYPTFTVNFLIEGGNNDVIYNGKVTLTSDTMWCSEFLNAISHEKNIVIEGIDKGNITKIANYEANISKNIFWFYDINGEESLFGVDHLQLRDGDFVKFYYKKLDN